MSALGSVELLPGQQSPDAIASQLRAAASAGRTSEVETLLSKGAAVDAQDADGDTALMLSIMSGHPDIVELLRKHGASLTLVNKAGQRAADLARTANNAEINRALGLAP
jgi:ankyrin repeat protein